MKSLAASINYATALRYAETGIDLEAELPLDAIPSPLEVLSSTELLDVALLFFTQFMQGSADAFEGYAPISAHRRHIVSVDWRREPDDAASLLLSSPTSAFRLELPIPVQFFYKRAYRTAELRALQDIIYQHLNRFVRRLSSQAHIRIGTWPAEISGSYQLLQLPLRAQRIMADHLTDLTINLKKVRGDDYARLVPQNVEFAEKLVAQQKAFNDAIEQENDGIFA